MDCPNIFGAKVLKELLATPFLVGGWGGWRVPNRPGVNPLVAERTFHTSDHWGLTLVSAVSAHDENL